MTAAGDIAARRQALRACFPAWRPRTLAEWLEECADSFGSRAFVIADTATLTYGDVAERSRCLAYGLIELGVGPGDRVGMLIANYPEFVTLKFAIARVGAIAVPYCALTESPSPGPILSRLVPGGGRTGGATFLG